MKNGIHSRNVRGHWLARRCLDTLYRIVAFAFISLAPSLTYAQAGGFDEQQPDYYVTSTSGGPSRQGSTVSGSQDSACQAAALLIQDSYAYNVMTLNGNLVCNVKSWDNGNQSLDRYFQVTTIPQCAAEFTWAPNDGDTNSLTGKCKRPKCLESTSVCYLKTSTAITTIPATACVASCLTVQSKDDGTERFIGGQLVYYYKITMATVATRCAVIGGNTPVTCNSGEPPTQDPCLLPGANTNPQCGGGTGCPAGYTVLANGACTPNDSNQPCPANYFRDAHGACLPFPHGPVDPGGSGGGGTGAGGTPGSNGNSGGTGGTGGNGGNGSSNGGGGGGGQGGQGGGGGAGGVGGGGGAGGEGGIGGASKDEVKCGTTGALCQNKFVEYYEDFKSWLGVSATVAAEGQAFGSQFADGKNALNTGPVVNIANSVVSRISYANSCPAPKTASVFGHSLSFDMTWICQLATMLGPFIAGLFGLAAIRILLSGG